MRRTCDGNDVAVSRSVGLLLLISFILIIIAGVGLFVYEFAVSFLG